ncbi:RsmB/NOP family class I SAM-dependent RNA methyltransferase [Oceanibium sediminis]|uniref:RsmB/NOP family class I SAM-dependent RNA methyltransferase n=1 Tax=Oceanibium sediminis TaxID=2026339 RepID=UPI000DD488E9|nr:transcription antitermination factor NusB [Oceanibium sediminis]
MSGAPGQSPRRAAARILGGVLERNKTLADFTEAGEGFFAELAPEERARATSIATGVLRHVAQIDTLLQGFLRKPPPAAVVMILRIAAWELLVDGVPPHAAVDGAVRAVRSLRKHANLAGLTNAVGRKLAQDGPAVWEARDAPELPYWLWKPVSAAYGADAAAAIALAHTATPPLDLTLRDPDDAARFADEVGGAVLPTGSVRLTQPGRVSGLPGYDQGRFWVQDAAAALPVQMLGALRGVTAVDLCAAPGGKTMQLAAAGARVTAIDKSKGRLARLSQNLKRTGLTADVVTSDARKWRPEGPAPDVIVLDAPCSATGTIRRHPDLVFARPDPDLAPLLKLQAELIDHALGLLAPGGRLLYCTCSLFPAEGEDQAAAALARHPGLTVDPHRPEGCAEDWWTAEGHLRLRPDFWAEQGGMDGFFATVLRKPDALP